MKRFHFIFSSFLLIAFSFIIAGCQFGDGDDGLEALAKKKRLLSYSCALTLPSLLQSDSALVDLGPSGLNVNWQSFTDIAVMGTEFRIKKDTIESASIPLPIQFSYNRYLSSNCEVVGNYSVLSYDFTSYAKHSNGEAYSTSVNFVYPYDRIISNSGDTLLANADSIVLDFRNQDGLLSTIADKYYIAMGHANAICSHKAVTFVDSAYCRVGHDHDTFRSERILLDTKIAVLRLSLIVPAQDDFTLLQYLRGKSISGDYYYIDHIQLSNRNEDCSGISRTQLNLRKGWMEPLTSAVSYLILSDDNHFLNHTDIARSEAQSWMDQDSVRSSWGTTVYVAIPCTEEGLLQFSPMVTVYVGQSNSSTITKYYGMIEPVTLKEGGYYITTPIRLYNSMEQSTTPANIYMTPNCY